MNQKVKRLLACILSALTISSALPVMANAANTGDAAETEEVEYFRDGDDIPIDLDEIDQDLVIRNVQDYYEFEEQNDQYAGLDRDADTETPDEMAQRLYGEYDNSVNENAKYLPAIKSQGGIGSCVAWAEVYYQYTYMINKARGITTTPANTYSPNFEYNLINYGKDDGSNAARCYKILQNQGAVTISDVPLITSNTADGSTYLNWFTENDNWKKSQDNRIEGYSFIDVDEEGIDNEKSPKLNLIKDALNKGEILSFSSRVADWLVKDVAGGTSGGKSAVGDKIVYAKETSVTSHRMSIVGYNDSIWVDINGNGKKDQGELGAFKVYNSWGTKTAWYGTNTFDESTVVNNNGGWIWVAYDALNKVSSVSNAPTVRQKACILESVGRMQVNAQKSQKSGIYLKYTLNTDNRSQNVISFTVTDENDNIIKNNSQVMPYAIGTAGGACSYNGKAAKGDGTMYYDLNNCVPNLNSDNLGNYTWKIKVNDYTKDSSDLTVKELKIIDENTNSTYDLLKGETVVLNGQSKEYEAAVGNVISRIKSITPDKTSAKLGDTVKFSFTSNITDSNVSYQGTATLNGSSEKLSVNNKTMSWTPSKAGTYTIKVDAVSGGKTIATKSISYTVAEANVVTIYYKGYSTPYIHYQTGSGTWTTAPGKAMVASNEVSGYTHKYTIDLGTASYANVCFNDGNNNWDSRNGSNYRFEKGTYTFSNGSINAISVAEQELSASLTMTNNGNVPVNHPVTITASATGGTAPYQYEFSHFRYGATTQLQSSSNSVSFTPTLDGYYTVTVKVTDAKGRTFSKSGNLTVTKITVYSFTSSADTIKTGEQVTFSAKVNTSVIPLTYQYTVSGNGVNQTLTTNSDNTASWKPTKEGTYTVNADIRYNSSTVATKSMSYTVEKGDVVTGNETTIYYKGYAAPYIHYQTGTGAWTAAPGKAMTATNEVSGYTHKYTIDLGTASYANVCFNDGNNSWDSNNGSNYRFEKGTYTYSNGKITAYTVTPQGLSATVSIKEGSNVPLNTLTTINASAAGGTAPYQYRYTYTKDGSETVISNYSSNTSATFRPSAAGTYTVKVTVKDSTGNTAAKTASLTASSVTIKSLSANKTSVKENEQVTFFASLSTNSVPVTYRYTVSGNGVNQTLTTNSGNTASWKPTKEGTYTVTLVILYNGSSIASKSISYKVEKGSVVTANQTTIYYKGYATPYIHYQVGTGEWTAVPGKAMTATNEISGYTHKYTIDLGTASYVNVCFNNGSNSWDSRNGSNYRFEKGTYTYANGTMIKISADADKDADIQNAELTNLSTVSASSVTIGKSVTVNAGAIGGSGDYTYAVFYKKTTDKSWASKQSYKANTTVTFKPAKAVAYNILVKVKDSDGTIVKKTFTLKVNEVLKNTTSISATSIALGKTVKVTANASGGSGDYTYAVYYKKATDTKWAAKQSYNTNASVSIKPAKAVKYNIRVKVKDSSGTISTKDFTVTVK